MLCIHWQLFYGNISPEELFSTVTTSSNDAHKSLYYINDNGKTIRYKIYPGESIEKLDVNKSFPWLDANSQQAKDIEKFRWFSNGYLGVDKKNRYVIYDVRFSTIPNQVEGLWGIKLDENKKDSEHVEYVTNRKRDLDRFNILINMVSGTHEN